MEKELEQTLQVEIMEPYLFLAEMKPKAKDPAKHMDEMREHWEALKAFITKAQAEAYQAGIRSVECKCNCATRPHAVECFLLHCPHAELHGNK